MSSENVAQDADGQKVSDQVEQQRQAEEREREFRNSMLSQCLDQDARARLNTLAMAKPDKARAVENMIIQMARFGQLRGKLDDAALRSLLDNASARLKEPSVSVKFDRRRAALDSDEEW